MTWRVVEFPNPGPPRVNPDAARRPQVPTRGWPRAQPPPRRYRYVRWRWRALCACIDGLGGAFIRAVQWCGQWWRYRAHTAATTSQALAQDPKRILVVQLDHLGDAVLSTGLLAGLRWRFPEARLEVLAAPWNQEVFQDAADVDEVHVSRWNRFSGRGILAAAMDLIGWGLALRRRRFDLAVDVRGELPVALLMWLAGAKCRVGWACGGGGFLLTHRPPWMPDRHEADARMALLSALGVPPAMLKTFRSPRLLAQASVDPSLPHHANTPSTAPVCVLHIGARTPAKRWPVEHWRRLVARLHAVGMRILLVGSEAERALAQAICGPDPSPQVADLTGTLRLAELAGLLRRADVFIGADSGPAHVAAAVGTESIVLFSGTNRPEQWRPLGPRTAILRHPVACSPCHQTRCPLADHPCMTGIDADWVFAVVQRKLARQRGRGASPPAERLPHLARTLPTGA